MVALALVVAPFIGLNLDARGAGSPTVRNAHALAYDADRARVLLFGGADEKSVRADLWEWDGRAWRPIASEGPPPRTFPALAYDRARKRLVPFGGNRVLFGTDSDRDTFLEDMWEWYEGAWHRVAVSTPPARAEASMVYDSARRRVVLFGGSGPSAETWEWDGTAWLRVEASAPGRFNSAMAYEAGRKAVLRFGGWDGEAREGDTWRYDGRR